MVLKKYWYLHQSFELFTSGVPFFSSNPLILKDHSKLITYILFMCQIILSEALLHESTQLLRIGLIKSDLKLDGLDFVAD